MQVFWHIAIVLLVLPLQFSVASITAFSGWGSKVLFLSIILFA